MSERLSALTAAMALVPNLYSRNRMYDLFEEAHVRRARNRARLIRSLLRFVARADDVTIERDRTGDRVLLRYRIPRLRLSRQVQLTDFELAVLCVLLEGGPRPSALAAGDSERTRVEAALSTLAKS